MKLKSKTRIKQYPKSDEFDDYCIEVKNDSGYWVNIIQTKIPNKDLAKKVMKLIIDNPNLITGYGYLFDIDYEK